MERVVLLAGRFQPPHPGHAQAYRQLCAQFGDEHVYVGTSDKQDPPGTAGRHPFNFAEKRALLEDLAGVRGDRVVQLRVPYKPVELLERFPAESTALIVSVSEKDRDRLRAGRYYRPLPSTDHALRPYAEAGYVIVTPLLGQGVAASEIRAALRRPGLSHEARFDRLTALYGAPHPRAFAQILDRLSPPVVARASETDNNCP